MPSLTDRPIGICVCGIQDETLSETIKYICLEAKKQGFSTVIFNSFSDFKGHAPDDKSAENVFSLPCFEKLCAVIILSESIQNDELTGMLVKGAKEAGILAVSIDKEIEGCTNILFRYGSTFEKIVRHVVEHHKFKDIYFLAGIKDNPFSDERIDVFRRVAEENGITFDLEKIGYGDFWDIPAEKAFREYLESGHSVPEAVICVNDLSAIAVCRVLESMGLESPKDVTVTGFDGIIQEKYHSPRFTTARQDSLNAGISAVQAVIDSLNGKKPPETLMIDYEVVFSQSCGCEPIVYKNNNDVVMNLYYSIRSKNELSINLNNMTNSATSKTSIREALSAIKDHIGQLKFKKMSVSLREAFLSDESFDFTKHIDAGEEMRTVIIFTKTVPESVDIPFRHGDTSPVDGVRTEEQDCFLIFMLMYQKKVYGYVTLSFDPEELTDFYPMFFFSSSLDHDVDTVKNTADIMSVNERLKATNRQLEEAFIHDSMTGLLNRRGFFMKIKDGLSRFERGYIFVSSIDLDNLKYINDNFGHHEGDFAIKHIAEAVKECCGEDGICARFGGDEFVAVMIYKDKRENIQHEFKRSFAEKLSAKNIAFAKEYLLSASVGSTVSNISPDFSLDNAIREADARMYRDKESKKAEVRNYRREDRD